MPFSTVLDVAPADDAPFLEPLPGTSMVPPPPLAYSQLHELVASIGSALMAAGVPRGTRVACALPNTPALAALIPTLPSSGFALAPLNPELPLEEMVWELSDLPAAALIVPAAYEAYAVGGVARAAAERLSLPVLELHRSTAAEGLFVLKPSPLADGATPESESVEPTGTSRQQLLDVAVRASAREDVALVMHTSGTTRRPKVVPIVHRHLGIGAACVASTLQLRRDDCCLNVMPLFHLHGLMVSVLATCAGGARLACAPKFEPADFVSRLRPLGAHHGAHQGAHHGAQQGAHHGAQNKPAGEPSGEPSDEPSGEPSGEPSVVANGSSAPRISWYSAVPTIHLEVLRVAESANETAAATHAANGAVALPQTLSFIRNCSAALAPVLSTRLEAALPGVLVLPTYAMTEALPICATRRDEPRTLRDLSSVGPASGPMVAVLQPSPADVTVEPGAEGEVVVRGACVFGGYEPRAHLGYDPNEGAFATTDAHGAWLRTGDKGWLDERGRIHLSGRFKEVINRAGEKVSPLAVEHALLALAGSALPALLAPLVFSMAHDELGETVGMAATIAPGCTLSLREVRAAMTRAATLSARWLPEVLVLLDVLPKGPTGKPARIGLAERLGLPPLCYRRSMLTIDQRAEALALAAAHEASRQQGAAANAPAPPPPAPPLDRFGRVRRQPSAFVALVLHAIHRVSGGAVGADEDLAEAAGLSSLTVVRLQESLAAHLGMALPSALLLQSATARALAASLLLHVRTHGARDGTRAETADARDARDAKDEDEDDEVEEEEEDASMLVADADAALRRGDAAAAAEGCLRAAALEGLSLAPTVGGEPAAASGLPARHHVPLLTTLALAASQLARDSVALAAFDGLAAALGPAHPDAPFCHAQLALLHRRRNDAEAATAATTAAMAAVAASSERAERLSRAALGERWAHPPAQMPFAVAPAALITLALTAVHLEAVPLALGTARRLWTLDVSCNRLATLPETIGDLRQLRDLLASGNVLTSLPESLASLPQLHVVSVQGNCFAALPLVLYRCRRLRHLKWGAQRRPLEGAHDGVGAGETESQRTRSMSEGTTDGALPSLCSTMLAVLELEANAEVALPPLVPTNTLLTTLLASFNCLDEPPTHLARHGRSLKKLHLGCNRLRSVDELLPPLTALVELTLEGNRLTSLPDAIGSLARLKELWVHGNELARLPEALGGCASLTVLQCHHNRLEELPRALATLGKLQGLYLQSNRLRGLSALRESTLRHLPLQNLGLGANCFELTEAFELPNARVGLGWNRGEAPTPLRGLSMWLATTDHAFEAASAGSRGQLLCVAFAAQGPGMQQWLAPIASVRSSGVLLDALYLADPSNSYYLQDPSGGWQGLRYFEDLVRTHTRQYERVLILGSSMGASAALQHAHLGQRTLAFGPRIDLNASHGTYVPAGAREGALLHTREVLRTMKGTATVHVGRTNFVDVAQTRHVEGLGQCTITTHDTYHHNVPQFLQQQGLLGAMIKAEVLELLLRAPGPLEPKVVESKAALGGE